MLPTVVFWIWKRVPLLPKDKEFNLIYDKKALDILAKLSRKLYSIRPYSSSSGLTSMAMQMILVYGCWVA